MSRSISIPPSDACFRSLISQIYGLERDGQYTEALEVVHRALAQPPAAPLSEDDILFYLLYPFSVRLLYLTGQTGLLPAALRSCRAAIHSLSDSDAVRWNLLPGRISMWAFVCFVSDLIRLHPIVPPEVEVKSRLLFVIGDSHCLTLAWRTIQCFNEAENSLKVSSHVFRPLLISGLKAFHLHPRFANSPLFSALRSHMERLKAGGVFSCLLTAGEIDCRMDEGIAVALAKGKHPSLETAVRETVRAFVEGLQALCEELDFGCVYVHPVPPPSSQRGGRTDNRTVALFNRALRLRLCADGAGVGTDELSQDGEAGDGKHAQMRIVGKNSNSPHSSPNPHNFHHPNNSNYSNKADDCHCPPFCHDSSTRPASPTSPAQNSPVEPIHRNSGIPREFLTRTCTHAQSTTYRTRTHTQLTSTASRAAPTHLRT
jgi:hypothetical protein